VFLPRTLTLSSLQVGICRKRSAQPPQDWAEEEFGRVRLRDRRHRERLCVVARDFFARPQANIPQACQTRANTKAAYRLLEHKAVKMDALLGAHYQSTMERIAREQLPVVLAVQDTTSFNYDTHAEMEGLGPINKRVDGAQGILMHATMAYTTQGTAMGLVDVQVWARDPQQFGKSTQRYERPIEQKESYKWLKSFQGASRLQRQLGSATTVVSVGDREADIYELFCLAQKDSLHPKLLVRAERNRLIQDAQMGLWQYMETQPALGERMIRIPRRKGRAARDARLEIRFAQVELRAPKRKPILGPLRVWAVYVTEVDPPTPKEAIDWMLVTTVEVNDLEGALEKVDWYKKRWGIEEYHRTIKSVCRIENRQLADRTVWENCLAIDLVVAWRIEHIKKISRESPQAPCRIAFDENEWQALFVLKNPTQPLPSIAPSMHQMTRWTAELGGFLGGKNENPGSTTLGRGLQTLHDILIGVSLAEQLHSKRPSPSHGDYG
jgi:transposase-like protein/transposase Tn5 family protein/DDE family transposase